MSSRNIFCVYVHRKESDGSIFYVGKGLIKRSSTTKGRSKYWHRVYEKHGRTVEIIKASMIESDAFELESFLISEIGRANLCNLTDGGEGCSGRIMSESQKLKASRMLSGIAPVEAVAAARVKNSKPVGTVCGMIFESSASACLWLNKNGHPTACSSGVYSSLSGKSKTAYGYQWRYILDGVRLSDEKFVPAPLKTMVRTHCGKSFDSPKQAAEWLRSIGFSGAQSSNITSACRGRIETAYGYKWEYSRGLT